MARQDDSRISGDMVLWRRIPPHPDNVKFDEETGIATPSSLNFDDKDNELSLYIASETMVETVMAGHDGFGLACLTAADVRAALAGAAVICRDSSDPAPGHIVVCAKLTRKQRKELASKCRWELPPTRNLGT
jgi:hypothetical protein